MAHDLNDYTEEELIERAWEIHDHNERLFTDATYMVDYLNGTHRGPDPMEDYDPDDPWFSEYQIELHLEERGRA